MAWTPITDLASLKAAVAEWLNRDAFDAIDQMITNATAMLRDDERVRNLKYVTLSITGDGLAYPSGFGEIESLFHDGPTYYGEIEIVSADQLGNLKARYGDTGVPQFVAQIEGDSKFYFAPEPSGTFSVKLAYWEDLVTLAGATTNWLLDTRPNIYLYATLSEAIPYLRDPNQETLIEKRLEKGLNALHKRVQRQQFSGTMTRTFKPIG
jgi:hypothetical protein